MHEAVAVDLDGAPDGIDARFNARFDEGVEVAYTDGRHIMSIRLPRKVERMIAYASCTAYDAAASSAYRP